MPQATICSLCGATGSQMRRAKGGERQVVSGE